MFAAAYGFVPEGTVVTNDDILGMLVNVPRVRAMQTLDMAQAISVAFGSDEAARMVLRRAGFKAADVDAELVKADSKRWVDKHLGA